MAARSRVAGARVQGARIMGTGIATSSDITFKDGRAQQASFNAYPVTRITGSPREINVQIVPATSTCLSTESASRAGRRCPGALQRHLPGDGQAHPAPDRSGPADRLSVAPRRAIG